MFCKNPGRCDGQKYLCGNCRRMFPTLAMDLDRKKRERKEARRNFGNGEVGGDRNWDPPIHGQTVEGRNVTFSQGKGRREGETLISGGHKNMDGFYGKAGDKGHDHRGAEGQPYGDRGKWRD